MKRKLMQPGQCFGFILIVCVEMIIHPAWAQLSEQQRHVDAENAKALIQSLVSYSLFVRLDWSKSPSWKIDEYQQVNLPNEALEHDSGVFRMQNVNAVVLGSAPAFNAHPLSLDIAGESNLRVLAVNQMFPNQEQCEQNALNFLQFAFPRFFNKSLPVPVIEGPSSTGIRTFKWQRFRPDEFPDTEVNASVRAVDGKIVAFGSSRFGGTWEHKIIPSQAKKIAEQSVEKGGTFKDIEVTDWNINGGGGTQWYDIKLRSHHAQTGRQWFTSITVNAITGKVNQGAHGWQEEQDNVSLPHDSLPVWSKRGLAFISNRKVEGMPAWAPSIPQVLLRDVHGVVTHLTQDLAVSPSSLFASPASNALEVTRVNWFYRVDLTTGKYHVLGTPNRPIADASESPDGMWAMVSATGNSGNPDYDLFADAFATRSSDLQLRARLILPGSDEYQSMFSPDGKWLYFVRGKTLKDGMSQTLCRLPVSEVKVPEMKRLDEKKVETLVILPNPAERMSFFPNGRHLLLQTRANLQIVDIVAGTVTPLKLPALTDAEIGAPVTDITDGWAGPTDDRITFSGQTKDKNGNVRRRIYSCHQNGSDLKAYTPKDNTPVPVYKFPNGENTGYDLAKTWALAEVKYEDSHRERSD